VTGFRAVVFPIFVIAVVIAGCGGEDAPSSMEDLTPKAQQVVQGVKSKVEYMKRKIDLLDKDMAKLAAKAKAKGAEVQAAYEKEKAEWDAKVKQAKEEIDRLLAEIIRNPGGAPDRAQQVYDELKEIYDKAEEKFGG